jgi:predicted dehydrogenase
VVQASTALWPGYPERIELHGTRGSAVATGDRLTAWDVRDDAGSPPPLCESSLSGASDPMAVGLEAFERQLGDFADAVRAGRPPLVSGREGFEALALALGIYASCRTGRPVRIEPLQRPGGDGLRTRRRRAA